MLGWLEILVTSPKQSICWGDMDKARMGVCRQIRKALNCGKTIYAPAWGRPPALILLGNKALQ